MHWTVVRIVILAGFVRLARAKFQVAGGLNGAEALHYGGASSANASTRFYIEMQRANIQFWRKHHGRIVTLAYLLVVWLHEVVQVLGHGALYCFKGSARHDAGFKVRRGLACLSWLSRSRSGGASVW
jgi:hypothetical protein